MSRPGKIRMSIALIINLANSDTAIRK